MNEFENLFSVNYDNAVSKNEAIYKGKKYRITILSELLIRIEYSESGSFEDRPTELAKFRNFEIPKCSVTEDDKKLIIETSYFRLIYDKEQPVTGTKLSPDRYFKVELVNTNKMWFFKQGEVRNFKSIASSIDESLDMPKLEKGLYSTDGFVSIDDSKSLIFNPDGSVGKRLDDRIDTYLFIYRKDFGYCLKDYYKLTGYPPLIPRFALGIWWNKADDYSDKELSSLIKTFRRNEIPISIMLLKKWTIDGQFVNKAKFMDFKSLIEEFHQNNIRVGLELPLDKITVNKDDKIIEVPFNVYDKKFLMSYFNNYIKPLDDSKIDFYSLNYTGHDLYAYRMINHYFFNYIKNANNKRGLILSKNGLIASHLYPIHNSGETIVDWKVLKMLPTFNSSSSNIGVSWWSHAIGGYKNGVEESNLYIRYIQFATYSPIFRFASKNGHYYKREPWKWDVKTKEIARDYTKMRHRLIPYLYSEAYKYAKTGLPLVQPLYYKYPELYDEPTYKNEYYFGTEFFIAPITDRKDDIMNRTVTKLFIPTGTWYDFKTGKKFPGGKRYISFFKDENYPVFVKSGGIIPLAVLNIDNLNDTRNPKSMEIHIFPGKNNSYKLYEDDGTTNEYLNGKYLTTIIDYNYLPNNYTVIIRPLEGTTDVIPETRSYKIRFRNTREADEVIAYLDDKELEVKTYLDDQDFIVETDTISTKSQLSINCKGKDIEIDAVRLINDDIDTIISDLIIPTNLKEKIAEIVFSDTEIKKKRIAIRKLSKIGLNDTFVKMFLKLLDYISEF